MKASKALFMAGFAILVVVLVVAMAEMRGFGRPALTEMDDHFIKNGQNETGANNIVTSVVFDYRGFDTLGEASVLFAAVLGIGVLLDWGRKKVSKEKAGKKNAAAGNGLFGSGMTKIVKTMTRIVFVVSVLFGVYVVVNGHLTPGGGFQGGAIIATCSAMLMVAFGFAGLWRHKGKFSALESVGLIMFIALAFIGIKTVFFDNFLAEPVAYGANPGALVSAGVIPLMNIAVGLEVLAALTVMLILMSRAGEKGGSSRKSGKGLISKGASPNTQNTKSSAATRTSRGVAAKGGKG
jgi:multicomponent Na+:H+ antiporter subunit B